MQKSSTIIPILHLLLYIAIGLNILVLRQITVFIYLSFVPGFVLLKILRLKNMSFVDIVLFSAGLSIAFLMFVGLLINELFLAVGNSQPLSTIPLTIILSFLTLTLFFVGNRRDLSDNLSSVESNSIDLKPMVAKSAILILPVILGVLGALYINQPVLLLMIMIVAAVYVLSVYSTKLVPSKLYPLVIFLCSLALAFQLLLISKYIIGVDAQIEYYVFRLTSINGYWHFLPFNVNSAEPLFDSMLSITILPTIYSALMNVNGEILFKVLYPVVFSFVPVTLYRIYERQMGKSASLLSTLFFISGTLVFYGVEPLSLNRQIVAEFFLVLSIFVWLDEKISVGKKRILVIVFSAAIIVSHYTVMFIYLALVSFIYAISKIKHRPDEVLNGTFVLFLFVSTFSWYTLASAPLVSLSDFFQVVFVRFLGDLFVPSTRGGFGGTALSLEPTFASMTVLASFLVANFFILIGVLLLLFKPARSKLDPKYCIVAILSAVILFICLVVPNVGPALNLERFYEIVLLFLAPCFVLGGKTLVDISENVLRRARILRRRSLPKTLSKITNAVLCVVLIVYFLSQSGFINCITGASPLSPLSFSLNYNRMRTSTGSNLVYSITLYSYFIPEQDVFSAVWLLNNKADSVIYADPRGADGVLTSYGLIPRQQISLLTNTTMIAQGDFVYLRQLNVLDGVLVTSSGSYFNTSEIYPILNQSNLIYSNGNSEIWYASR